MVTATLKRLGTGFFPVAVLSLLLLVSLYLMSAATQNSEQFGRIFFVLLVVNVLGLITLLVLIAANLIRLVRQYRSQATGSRLTARLVVIFVVLSLLPVSVLYYFSLGFIQRGIDSWFDVRVESALDDALELTRLSLDERKKEILRRTEMMAENLYLMPDESSALLLNDLREQNDAYELVLFNRDAHVLGFSNIDPAVIIPALPDRALLTQLEYQGNYIGLDNKLGEGLFLRVIVPVHKSGDLTGAVMLQSLYTLSDRVGGMVSSVESAYAEYKRLTLMRDPLKFSFTLTLSLVLLLSCLTAVWAAFFSARRLVAPIRALSIGTRAVASGDYKKRLPLHSKDELGFLVESFNDMTHRIALSRDEVNRSQQMVERERAYLRVVLGRLSSGVLTLDKRRRIRTANASANQVLGLDLKLFIGKGIDTIVVDHQWLEGFVSAIDEHLSGDEREWREEVVVFAEMGRQIITCAGTAMATVDGKSAGYVIVFDDVTALVQAQRDAAWGEVARRLAHEIKNPLTPIQLSAERLRHKYLKTMSPQDADLLDRSTHTIIQQVKVMKEMVQSFSEYAHAPTLNLLPLPMGDFINEILDLYRGDKKIKIEALIDDDLPLMMMDAVRMRQLLHNLLVNAVDAVNAMDSDEVGLVKVSCHHVISGSAARMELQVQDSGPGIPENMMEQLFEPYVTSKPKGSGLGLAVVKKIVEEHGGSVQAKNTELGGCVIIRFPLDDARQKAVFDAVPAVETQSLQIDIDQDQDETSSNRGQI